MSTECRSAYLHNILDPPRLKKAVKALHRIIKRKVGVDNFDAIAYRGMSGAGVATTLGYLLNKPLIMVRKKGVTAHTDRKVEGAFGAKRIIIVDDCIATGETLVAIVRDILVDRMALDRLENIEPLEVVAVLLYNDAGNRFNLLTGEDRFVDSFRAFIERSIRHRDENYKALEAMANVKVYNFDISKDGDRLRMYAGTNLELDDLR